MRLNTDVRKQSRAMGKRCWILYLPGGHEKKTKGKADEDINNSLGKPNQNKIWACQSLPFTLKRN